jgi:hypothetical protein
LLAASLAHAAVIPTSYFVDEKTLKKNATPTTNLTFELFSDPNCSLSALATDVVAADDVTVKERVKTRRIRGGAKPLKLVELHHVFNAAPDHGSDLYVKVTGTGIDPNSMGACQAQEPYGDGMQADHVSGCITVPAQGPFPVDPYGTPPGTGNVIPVCCPTAMVPVNSGFHVVPFSCLGPHANAVDVFNAQDAAPPFGPGLCSPNDGWVFQINDDATGSCGMGGVWDAFVTCCP